MLSASVTFSGRLSPINAAGSQKMHELNKLRINDQSGLVLKKKTKKWFHLVTSFCFQQVYYAFAKGKRSITFPYCRAYVRT